MSDTAEFDIQAILDQARTADGKVLSDERLREVWEMVRPSPWKGPIEAEVAKDRATSAEIVSAVTWFAGGAPEVSAESEGYWRVRGEGYYIWIGS